MNLSFFRRKPASRSQKINESPVNYDAYATTDVGAVRENNEDHVLFTKPNDAQLLKTKGVLGIVADGMGGHNHGEIASRMAVEIITNEYYGSEKAVEAALKDALEVANIRIYHASKETSGYGGMGTTCTTVVIVGNDVILAHVGDSRAYHLRDGHIRMLTKDHSYVQHLVDEKVIKKEQAALHPQRNVITKSLGPNDEVIPDIRRYPDLVAEEDVILLCSDGLYEYITDEEFSAQITAEDITNVGSKLVALAKERGGHDNISVLLIQRSGKKGKTSSTSTKEIEES